MGDYAVPDSAQNIADSIPGKDSDKCFEWSFAIAFYKRDGDDHRQISYDESTGRPG